MVINNIYWGFINISDVYYGSHELSAVIEATSQDKYKVLHFNGTPGIKTEVSTSISEEGDIAVVGCDATLIKSTCVIKDWECTPTRIGPTTIIGNSAFQGVKLDNVTIPKTVALIQITALNGADIKNLTVATDNQTYKSEGNCILHKDTGRIVCGMKYSKPQLATSARSVGQRAFQNVQFKEVPIIPQNIQSIGQWAFSGSNITNATLDQIKESTSQLTSIEQGAFSGCTSMEGSLDLWDSKITKFGGGNVFGDTNITALTLPTTLTEEGFLDDGVWPESLDSLFLPGIVTLKPRMIGLFSGTTLHFTGHPLSSTRYVNNLRQIKAGSFLNANVNNLKYVYVWGTKSSWKAVDSGGNQKETATFDDMDFDVRAQNLCQWLLRWRGYDCIRTDV